MVKFVNGLGDKCTVSPWLVQHHPLRELKISRRLGGMVVSGFWSATQ